MIDTSGSQSAAGIPNILAAVRYFIERASAANVTIKPRLAIGSFNTPCSNQAEPCNTGDLLEARMQASLSNNYTNLNVAVGPLTQIAAAPLTGTNIKEGLETARLAIVAGRDPTFQDYVILMTDGDPTFPGYYTPPCIPGYSRCYSAVCNNNSCPLAESSATTKAVQLRAANIRVITVPYTTTSYSGNGPALLTNQIAFNSQYAYNAANGNSNLNNIFGLIFDQIVCNDNRDCTADFCAGNTCSATSISCPTPTATATPTITPTATNTATPTATFTPTATATFTPTATPTATPLPTVNTNNVCTSQSLVANQSALFELTSSQGTQLNRLSREVQVRVPKCPSPRAARGYTARARRALQRERNTSIVAVRALPPAVLSCPAGATNCASSSIGFSVSSYVSRSDKLRKLTIEGANLVRQCKGFRGKCEGSVAGCIERTQYRADLYRLELSRANGLHKSNINNANGLPKQNFQCR